MALFPKRPVAVLLLCVLCAGLSSAPLLAQDTTEDVELQALHYDEADFADIPYIESTLGIDYRALADFPVSHMLSHGEAEWLENARADYGEDTVEAWAVSTAPFIGQGRVSEAMIEEMRAYTPHMLLSFIRLDANDDKYGYLEVLGRNFRLDQVLEKMDEETLSTP